MDYKNFFLRSLISIIFIILYIIIIKINFKLIIVLISMFYIIIALEVIFNFKNNKFIILLYLFLSYLFFYNLDFENIDLRIFNLLIIIIVFFDIFSYFAGKLFGKHKIAKNISPNKTIEGFIGGIIFSISVSFIYSYVIELEINNLLLFTILIILSSYVGDLIESLFKRKNDLKNSSSFIPGHGGFFDRFDSFVFAIIPFSLIYNIL